MAGLVELFDPKGVTWTAKYGVVSGARVLDRHKWWEGQGWFLRSVGWLPVVAVSASEATRTLGMLCDDGWPAGFLITGCTPDMVPVWHGAVVAQRERCGQERWTDCRLFVDCNPPWAAHRMSPVVVCWAGGWTYSPTP